AKTRYQLFTEIAARPFCEQRVFPAQFHAACEVILWLAVLANAHVAGCDTGDRTVRVKKHLGRSKAGIDFNAKRFRFGCEPAANIAKRDNKVAVIAHQRRHYEIGQPQRMIGRKVIEAIVGDGSLDRCIFGAPVRKESVKPDWVDDGSGKNMRTNFGPLLHHHHRDVRIDLLETDRAGQARRAGADNHHIEFHHLATGHLSHEHFLFPGKSSAAWPRWLAPQAARDARFRFLLCGDFAVVSLNKAYQSTYQPAVGSEATK